MVTRGEQHLVEAWRAAVDGLAMDVGLADALTSADLLAVNLEGTFHHHSLGALALGGALALAVTMADIDLIVISSMYQDAIAAQLLALDQGHKLLMDDADRDALKSLQITADGLVRIAPVDATHG